MALPTTSLNLDGSSAYLTVPAALDYNSDYTALLYCKPTITPAGSKAVLWILNGTDSNNADIILIRNTGFIEVQIVSGGTSLINTSVGDGTGVLDTWGQIGIRRQSGTYTIWKDAVNLGSPGSPDTSGRTTAADKIAIGAYAYDAVIDSFLKGNILGLRLWSRALTDFEVPNEVGSLHPQSTAGFFGGWMLDDTGDLVEFTGSRSAFTAHGTIIAQADLPTITEQEAATVNISGSITPVGSVANGVPVESFLAGSSSAAGIVAKIDLLLDSVKGSIVSTSTLNSSRISGTSLVSLPGSISAIGIAHKNVQKKFTSSVTSFSTIGSTKLDIKTNIGTSIAVGLISHFDLTIDSIHGSAVPSSTLVTVRIPKPVEILFAGSLVIPSATIKKQANKHLIASSSAVGTASPNAINTELLSVSGSIIPAGNGSYEGIPRSLLDQFFYWLRHHR